MILFGLCLQAESKHPPLPVLLSAGVISATDGGAQVTDVTGWGAGIVFGSDVDHPDVCLGCDQFQSINNEVLEIEYNESTPGFQAFVERLTNGVDETLNTNRYLQYGNGQTIRTSSGGNPKSFYLPTEPRRITSIRLRFWAPFRQYVGDRFVTEGIYLVELWGDGKQTSECTRTQFSGTLETDKGRRGSVVEATHNGISSGSATVAWTGARSIALATHDFDFGHGDTLRLLHEYRVDGSGPVWNLYGWANVVRGTGRYNHTTGFFRVVGVRDPTIPGPENTKYSFSANGSVCGVEAAAQASEHEN